MTTNSSLLVSDLYPAILKFPLLVGKFAVATRSTVFARVFQRQSLLFSGNTWFSTVDDPYPSIITPIAQLLIGKFDRTGRASPRSRNCSKIIRIERIEHFEHIEHAEQTEQMNV